MELISLKDIYTTSIPEVSVGSEIQINDQIYIVSYIPNPKEDSGVLALLSPRTGLIHPHSETITVDKHFKDPIPKKVFNHITREIGYPVFHVYKKVPHRITNYDEWATDKYYPLKKGEILHNSYGGKDYLLGFEICCTVNYGFLLERSSCRLVDSKCPIKNIYEISKSEAKSLTRSELTDWFVKR